MTILTNVRIWDGLAWQDPAVDTIEYANDEIVRLGPRDEFDLRNASDLHGLTIMPGLIDAHVHLCLDPDIQDPLAHGRRSDDDLRRHMAQVADGMARAGITTARDLGGGRWLELELRDEIRAGRCLGPRLLCAGQPVTSPGGHCHFWGGEAASEADAIDVVERQLGHGADLIKVMATGGNLTPGSKPADAQFDQAVLEAIVRQAAQAGRHVAAHCHGTVGIGRAAAAGVRTIEHCSWVGEDGWGRGYDPDIAAALASDSVWVSPTVNLGWRRRIGSGDYETRVRGNFKAMKAAGVRLIASTDAGIPGVYHRDLSRALPVFAYFADLDNEQVLRAATSECADAIGLGDVTGRIEPGFAADLLLIDGDPVRDLSCLASPADVICAGRSVHQVVV